MDSGDISVETTTVIVMQSTIDYLVGTNQMDKLNSLMDGAVEKKTIWLNEDEASPQDDLSTFKDAMEQTGDEVTYYKQLN